MIPSIPNRTTLIRAHINYYIDDGQIPSDPEDSLHYFISSRKALAGIVVQAFFFLRKKHLLNEFCDSLLL